MGFEDRGSHRERKSFPPFNSDRSLGRRGGSLADIHHLRHVPVRRGPFSDHSSERGAVLLNRVHTDDASDGTIRFATFQLGCRQ